MWTTRMWLPWLQLLCVALCRSSYKGAVKGVAYIASALDSHWERVRPALRSAIEGELASRKGRPSHACHNPACLAAETLHSASHLQPLAKCALFLARCNYRHLQG